MGGVILGIDPSSIRCGWAVLTGDKLIAHSTICNDKAAERAGWRIYNIGTLGVTLCSDCNYKLMEFLEERR